MKKQLILIITLFLFWLVLSSNYDIQHIVIGLLLACGLTLLWHDSADLLPNSIFSLPIWLKFAYYLLLLGWEILSANIRVIKSLTVCTESIEPKFLHFTTNLKTAWGRVILANSITLTPGTVTVDVNPKNGDFLIHALTPLMADNVPVSRLVKKVEALEAYGGGKQ